MLSQYLQYLKRSRLILLIFAITFFTSGLIVNTVQCILYLTLRNFSKYYYRKLNWYLCATLYCQLVFVADWWSGSDLELYIDEDDYKKYYGKEHAYCIMNHTYEIDWLVGWMAADRVHLIGNCKAYVKKVMGYFPVLGWTWKFSEFVFLERSFDKDKDIINRQISELADHPDPMWLLLFPEGTRFTEQKHKVSEEFAQEHNLTPLKHHLQPRTRGFIASLPSMHDKVSAIYDIFITFKNKEQTAPTLTNLLFGKPVQAVLYMHRIPFSDVPKDEPGQEKFLRDMFVKKDKMMDSFINTGDLFETSGVTRIKPFKAERRLHCFLQMLMWAVPIVCPMVYYILCLLLSGDLKLFSIGAGIILFFIVLLKKTVNASKITKGSTYGSGTPKKHA